MAIEPPHDGLDDIVQDFERDPGRHLDLAPDQRLGVPQLDANRGDLVETLRCSARSRRIHHAANLPLPGFRFHGSRSSLWMILLAIPASLPAEQVSLQTAWRSFKTIADGPRKFPVTLGRQFCSNSLISWLDRIQDLGRVGENLRYALKISLLWQRQVRSRLRAPPYSPLSLP